MPYKNKEKRKSYMKEYYKNNSGKIKEITKQYYQNNQEKIKEYVKKYYAENIDDKLKYAKQYRDEPKNKEKQIEYIGQYRIEHRSEILEQVKKYRNNNPEVRRNRDRNKYRTDLKFNLNDKIKRAINISLKGNKNGRCWETLVDYTLSDLIKQLKSTISEGYTWQDFIQGKLHIDHIIPIKAFIFKTPEDKGFKDCWSLYNLRLLSVEENILKGDKITNPILLNLLLNEVI